MAAPANADIMKALAQVNSPFTVYDDLSANLATGATSQAQGLALKGEVCRITLSVTGGSCVLPSLAYGDAPNILVVVNDSANSINVGGAYNGANANYPADKVNGVATTASFGAGIVAVAAGTFAVFVASQSPLGTGGVATSSPNNWHTAVSPGT